MVHVEFGPHLDGAIHIALLYAAYKARDVLEFFTSQSYNEEDKTLDLLLKPGHWTIGDIEIKLERVATHVTDCRLIPEIKGYFKAATISIINKFFEDAHNYANNKSITNVEKGTIKCLKFEYGGWDTESSINKRSLSTIHLPEKVFSKFSDDIEKFLSVETIERYKKLEIPHSRVYLLYGPPGTGKTSLIQAIASKYDMSIGSFTVDGKTDDHHLKKCIKRLPKRAVLVIEDIDSFFVNRKTTNSELTYSGFLNAIDGVNRLNETIIFVTTNYLETIDSALKRRVDYFVKFDFCTKEQVKSIFERFQPKTHFDKIWETCRTLKLTPSILQKFLIRDLPIDELPEFVSGDHSLEKLPEMYT